MGKNTKTVWRSFDYMHCDDFAKYLMEMAAKGWHFKEWGAGLKFEKGEPEQAVYAVEVFSKASENDVRPHPNTQEFAEYCEAAGWKFIDAKQKFCIFKKIDQNAMELFTQEERVTNAYKGMFSGSAILILVLYGLNVVLQWKNIAKGMKLDIFSGIWFFSFSIWHLLFLGQLLPMICAVWKRKKLQKDIQVGKRIYIGNRKDGKYHLNLKMLLVVLLTLLLMYAFFVMNRIGLIVVNAMIIVGMIIFGIIINKVRPERGTYVIIQIVFVYVMIFSIGFFTMVAFAIDGEDVVDHKDLPLEISDYREFNENIEDINYSVDRNFLGSAMTCSIWEGENSIRYEVYKTKHTMILDRIWEEEVEERNDKEDVVDCTSDWGAKKAVRNKQGVYHVRYDNVLLIFSEDTEIDLTKEQINIICDKLEVR